MEADVDFVNECHFVELKPQVALLFFYGPKVLKRILFVYIIGTTLYNGRAVDKK